MYETNYQMPVMSRKDQAIRNFFSQPKFLWIGVSGFVLTFLSLFIGPATISLLNSPIFIEKGISFSEIEQITPVMNIIMVIASLIGSVPTILNSVAYLLLHLNAKNPAKNFKTPTTILNVIATIGFVLTCIFTGLLVLIFVLAGLGLLFMPESYGEDATIGLLAFFFMAIFYLAIIAISLLITHTNMSYTNSLKKSTTTDELAIKGVKGYSIIIILSLISLGSSAFSCIPYILVSPLVGIFMLVVTAISFVQYLLMYQFVSGFGKIIKTEEATRTFESAPYNQVPVAGEAFDNQRPYYNNPYTAPQETEVEVVEANLCKQCGNPVNDDDYFCMKCGTRIERD